MIRKPYLIHALSPLHAGTGASTDVIDLPIARMKATGIPFLPGSSIKGVMRDAARQSREGKDVIEAVYGPETLNAADHAGAIVVSDARLLALPVRSFRGTFAWVTSPLLLMLAKRDLGSIAAGLAIPDVEHPQAIGSPNSVCNHEGKVYLEDLDLPLSADESAIGGWAGVLAQHIYPERPDLFIKRMLVIDDETMSFLFETATQVDVRVRIDPVSRTVVDGALWQEESLPPETLLIGQIDADRSRRRETNLSAEQIMELALSSERTLQFGGKRTVGRGHCRIVPFAKIAEVANA